MTAPKRVQDLENEGFSCFGVFLTFFFFKYLPFFSGALEQVHGKKIKELKSATSILSAYDIIKQNENTDWQER